MEYIESRLSNRASGNTSQSKSSSAPRSDAAPHATSAPPKETSGREVMQGHLDEHVVHAPNEAERARAAQEMMDVIRAYLK